MNVRELIGFLESVPSDMEVFINGEFGWSELSTECTELVRVFEIQYSDYNGNGVPYTLLEDSPHDVVYKRENGKPDYTVKTLGEKLIVSLG